MHPIPSNWSRDIRSLETQEVSSLGTWLNQYLRMELDNPRITDSKLLLDVLVRSTREFESDFGVFTPRDEA